MSKRGMLKERLKKSYADKDKGSSGQPAFNWKAIKSEVKFYKMQKGSHRLNIIPYIIKSKDHPLVKSGDAKVGDQDYLYDAFIHRSIGLAQTAVICPKRNFGKACPICAMADKYREKGKQKESSALKAQRMAIYNVVDANDPDEGIQVLQISHAMFEKELIEEARESSDNGDIVDFPDIVEGKIVKFRASEASFDGYKYFKFKNFSFEDRDEKLDEDLIKEAISFDAIAKLYSAEEIEKLMSEDEEDSEDDSEDDEGDDSEDDDDDDEEEEEDEKPKKGKASSKKKVKDEEEEEEEEETEEEAEEPEEEEEEEPEGKPKGKKAPAKKPEAKAGKESACNDECPKGHKFGKDCDCFEDDCDDCECWDECIKAQKKLEKAAPKAAKSKK